jgi:hemolysin III
MPALTPKNSKQINDFYTLGEEIANSVTHGIGTGLAIAGLTVLIFMTAMQQDVTRIVSVTIFGSSLVLCYLASTLYHSFQQPRVKRVFRIVDHAAIYLLIAGSYTPYLLIAIQGRLGWTMLILVWTLAIIGITFKLFFIGKYEIIATAGYVAMGWLCVFAFREMIANIPPDGLRWLFAGGFSYTFGVIFFAWNKLPYNHAIWHLFVLAGGACHFFSVLTLLN